ncbi:hypothetical protein PO909_027104 [Leuciscus waleckii]
MNEQYVIIMIQAAFRVRSQIHKSEFRSRSVAFKYFILFFLLEDQIHHAGMEPKPITIVHSHITPVTQPNPESSQPSPRTTDTTPEPTMNGKLPPAATEEHVRITAPTIGPEPKHRQLVPSLHLGPSTCSLHQRPSTLRLHQAPSSLRLHQAPSSLRLHQAPSSLRLHQAPSSLRLHQAPSSLRLHQAPSSLRLHQASSSLRLHQAPSSLRLYQAPSSLRLHLGQPSPCLFNKLTCHPLRSVSPPL